jgi:hypothetical protein
MQHVSLASVIRRSRGLKPQRILLPPRTRKSSYQSSISASWRLPRLGSRFEVTQAAEVVKESPARLDSANGLGFPDNFPGVFIISQRYEFGVPELVRASPFREIDSYHDFRF